MNARERAATARAWRVPHQGPRLDADPRGARPRAAQRLRARREDSLAEPEHGGRRGRLGRGVRPVLRALPAAASTRRCPTRCSRPAWTPSASGSSYNRAAYSFGTCATFNTALKKVREFKIGGEHGVSGDYYAGKIYNGFVRYVSNRQRAAARAHWGSRYDNALDAASAQLKAARRQRGHRELLPLRLPRLSRACSVTWRGAAPRHLLSEPDAVALADVRFALQVLRLRHAPGAPPRA